METKKCKRCGEIKPLSEYYKDSDSWCMECHRSYQNAKVAYSQQGIKSKMCKVCKCVRPLNQFAFKPNGKRSRVCNVCREANEGAQLQLSIAPKTNPNPNPIAKTNAKTNIKTTRKMEKNVKKGAPKVSVLTKILDRLFGKKYYANIINRRGTTSLEMSSFIFGSRQEAEKHRISLEMNLSFQWVETISFRSREEYV